MRSKLIPTPHTIHSHDKTHNAVQNESHGLKRMPRNSKKTKYTCTQIHFKYKISRKIKIKLHQLTIDDAYRFFIFCNSPCKIKYTDVERMMIRKNGARN